MCFSIQVDRDLKKLAKRFNALIDNKAFEKFLENKQKDAQSFKAPDQNNRIYPNYYAPVIIEKEGSRIITPMRYQLLPSFCKEDKYTRLNPKTGRRVQVKTYNARLDSLEKRHAWKNIFTTQHAIVPFTKFYEYIPRNKKWEVAGFYPKNRDIMWSAALWDRYSGEEGEIDSFAIITDEPPKEVREAGHDRCPIFIKEDNLDEWLKKLDRLRTYELLQAKEDVIYKYEFVEKPGV